MINHISPAFWTIIVRLSTWNLRDFPTFYVGHFAKNKITLLLNTYQLQTWFAETQTQASLENPLLRTLHQLSIARLQNQHLTPTFRFLKHLFMNLSACLLFCSFVIVFMFMCGLCNWPTDCSVSTLMKWQ
jgi:hypothetical protein